MVAGDKMRRHQLDGDDALQTFVECPQDNPHGAATDDAQNLIVFKPAQRSGRFPGTVRLDKSLEADVPCQRKLFSAAIFVVFELASLSRSSASVCES
jgi:hypothetical protein